MTKNNFMTLTIVGLLAFLQEGLASRDGLNDESFKKPVKKESAPLNFMKIHVGKSEIDPNKKVTLKKVDLFDNVEYFSIEGDDRAFFKKKIDEKTIENKE